MFSVASRSALRSVLTQTSVASRSTGVVGAARMSSTRLYSTMHDNDPELIEREKKRTLSGEQLKTPHIDGAPGWNEHLASSAEASLKADKHDNSSVEDMQRKTVDYVHTRHSPDERVEPREAGYQRDEVHGPLSTSHGNPPSDNDDVQVSHGKTLKRKMIHEETTEILQEEADPTSSESNVRADRGEFKI